MRRHPLNQFNNPNRYTWTTEKSEKTVGSILLSWPSALPLWYNWQVMLMITSTPSRACRNPGLTWGAQFKYWLQSVVHAMMYHLLEQIIRLVDKHYLLNRPTSGAERALQYAYSRRWRSTFICQKMRMCLPSYNLLKNTVAIEIENKQTNKKPLS